MGVCACMCVRVCADLAASLRSHTAAVNCPRHTQPVGCASVLSTASAASTTIDICDGSIDGIDGTAGCASVLSTASAASTAIDICDGSIDGIDGIGVTDIRTRRVARE